MIVAGFGFRSGATVESLLSALRLSGGRPNALASAKDKTKTEVFQAVAQHLDLPVIAVDSLLLVHTETHTQSLASQRARGTGSVAEAAALAGAGPDARLLRARVISDDGRATCALAQGGNR